MVSEYGSPADSSDPRQAADGFPEDGPGLDLTELLAPVTRHWRGIAAMTLVGAIAGYGSSFLVTPLYKSHTTLIPPQSQQSSAAAALTSLGAIGGLAAGGLKSPIDQYVSLFQSEAVTDKLIERFGLMKAYKTEFRDAARKMLLSRTSITAGKKDGIITVEVEDDDPKRAAAIATQYVEELRRLTATLAVTEPQQRRLFFENQMLAAKAKLTEAQAALQQSGFNKGALNAEPQSASAGYARLRSDLAAAQVRLATLENSLAPTAPEVRQQSATVSALQDQLRQLESSGATGANSPDYVSKYRAFKYEETLFDLMAKQYEIARVDESREGALIQIVDPARPAEHRSWPRRGLFLLVGAIAGPLLAALYFISRARRAAAGTR